MRKYNKDISIEELAEAIERSKNTSPGLDSFTNTFIKSLPNNILEEYKILINKSFSTGIIPDSWKISVVIFLF